MSNKNTFNDTYLAKWINSEITNNQLKEAVSEDDYNSYIKLKSGINLYQELEAPTENTFAKIKDKIRDQKENISKKGSKVRSLYFKGAIAIAASIVLFFSVFSNYFNNTVIIQSTFGELKTIALLDNSEVILNAKSEIKYNKKDWKRNRTLHLKGEAFFKVQKGKTFTVITDNGTVTVLGTKFNVNSQNSFFEVTCYEGKVKVVNAGKKVILTPNKTVRNINGNTTEQTLNSQTNLPSWTLGESSFRSVPLREVLSALEKQFNIKIVTNNIDESIVFTGAFDNKNRNLALAAVFKTVQIRYKIKDNVVILSK